MTRRRDDDSEDLDDEVEASFPATPPRQAMPDWYPELLASVSRRVAVGRSKAITAANQEVVATYWAIGRDILERQDAEGYGTKVIDRLSADLRRSFPEARGFSPRNLKYMRAFASTWSDRQVVQAPLAQLPWYHQIALMEKLKSADLRLWYAERALSNGWSRAVLALQIEYRLHDRAGKAITNFITTLPPGDSDMAQQATKDPYLFDFVGVADRREERAIQGRLVEHIEKFLLELGQGFAFVGEQVRLVLAGDEFYADLLFYHLRLRCYVVIELKAVKFKPEFLGQVSMYMAAVDDLLAHPDDKPTIGLLLCRTKNNVAAEYALRGYRNPIGVAQWATSLTENLPEELASSLPSIEALEAELTDLDEDVT
jgi:predicted nuclease of restriction endonuclease-like (RecB) superfamily